MNVNRLRWLFRFKILFRWLDFTGTKYIITIPSYTSAQCTWLKKKSSMLYNYRNNILRSYRSWPSTLSCLSQFWLGPVYTKRQRQHCDNSVMMLANLFSLKLVESLENRLQHHSGATPLFSMRTESQASSLSCCSVDVDAWCKWALTIPCCTISEYITLKAEVLFLSLDAILCIAAESCFADFVTSLQVFSFVHSSLGFLFNSSPHISVFCTFFFSILLELW